MIGQLEVTHALSLRSHSVVNALGSHIEKKRLQSSSCPIVAHGNREWPDIVLPGLAGCALAVRFYTEQGQAKCRTTSNTWLHVAPSLIFTSLRHTHSLQPMHFIDTPMPHPLQTGSGLLG